MTATERDNLRHWDPAQRGVYEVWYLTWNDPASGDGYWLRYICEAPLTGSARGELWFARFDRARPERTFGIHHRDTAVAATHPPFQLTIGDAGLGHDHAVGELAGDGHQVAWDLRWAAAPRALRQLPDVMYARGGLGETTVVSPNPRCMLVGTLDIDGQRVALDGAVLGQSHVWGKKHAYAWTWGRCAELLGAPDAVLELLAVRLQRRGVVLPTLALVVLEIDGERHQLNQLRHLARNRARWGDGRVEFNAWSSRVRIEGELVAPADAFVMAPYEDPDGTSVYCANTEVGDARVTVYRRAGLGWTRTRELTCRGRAHFELGGRTRDARVVRDHVLV
jgi:hypothetical protein